MKIQTLVLVLILIAPAVAATRPGLETVRGDSSSPLEFVAGEYGPWDTVDGYPGLQVRARRAGWNDSAKKYKWDVQYRNNYRDVAHVSTVATATRQTNVRTTDRLNIKPGETASTWFLLAAEHDICIYTDKLRVGKDTGDYVRRKD